MLLQTIHAQPFIPPPQKKHPRGAGPGLGPAVTGSSVVVSGGAAAAKLTPTPCGFTASAGGGCTLGALVGKPYCGWHGGQICGSPFVDGQPK
jgi:hypothetical protein